jgi:threonine aldolase
MPERDAEAVHNACTHFVSGHYPKSPRETLEALAAFTPKDTAVDYYGGGKLMAAFEANVAALLGKPAAVFMPSGTMAQQIALRVWADRTGNRTFACHPTCHLELHEDWAYRTMHGLHAELVGSRHELMTLDDLQRLGILPGTLLLELPQRPIGGVLPEWDDLVAMTGWAHEQGIMLHMDGARLWECKPYYKRDYAEIAGLFDTVYVSFYKVLEGLSGAVLAGPEDVIAEARVWQHRHGGRLFHLYPYVLSAEKGLADHLEKMPAYYEKAVEIGAALAAIDGIEVKPNPPQTPMMHVFLRGDNARLLDAALAIAEETGVWLLRSPSLATSQIPAYQMLEIAIGDASLDVPASEITSRFTDLIHRANLPAD